MGTRQDYSPGHVALGAAIPIGAATAARAVRGIGRTLTRTVPSLFERAQAGAQQAGAEMVESLRPTVNVGQLAQGVEAASGDRIPMAQTAKVMQSVRLPPTPYPQQQAAAATMENLKALVKPGGDMALGDVETIRRGLGPIAGRTNAPREAKALYSALVRDLEGAGQGGSAGAAMARDMATAFKQEQGAARLAELIDQASPIRMVSGAETRPLNIGAFSRLIERNRDTLERNLGPAALTVVDAFIERFRGLPPTVAWAGLNRLLTGLVSAAGGAGGAFIGGPGGAALGLSAGPALEFATNMALVGRNPALVNQLVTTALQSARAAALQGARAVTGWEPEAATPGRPTADELLGFTGSRR
jgi:hypothetical protein